MPVKKTTNNTAVSDCRERLSGSSGRLAMEILRTDMRIIDARLSDAIDCEAGLRALHDAANDRVALLRSIKRDLQARVDSICSANAEESRECLFTFVGELVCQRHLCGCCKDRFDAAMAVKHLGPQAFLAAIRDYPGMQCGHSAEMVIRSIDAIGANAKVLAPAGEKELQQHEK